MALFSEPVMAQNLLINDISITGNRQSRASVILRELVFSKGDTVAFPQLQTMLDVSRNNIINTSLFNYVYVTADTVSTGTAVNIKIEVEERWYIWPVVDLVFEDRNISTWIRNPNWSRFSFGAGVDIQNMRGLNEKLHITARIGYQRGVSLSYADIALDRAKRHLFGFSTSYNMVHNTAYKTENNKPLYVTTSENPVRQRYSAGINYLFRPEIHERHTANITFEHTSIDDTLLLLNRHYWGGTHTRRNNINVTYSYANDHRDVYFYPLEGTFFKITGAMDVALDGSLLTASVYPEFGFYKALATRWFYAGVLNGKMTVANTRAYLVEKALGYGANYLRGYEDYVMDGHYFALMKNTLRFLLMPTKVIEIKWLSGLPKFNKIHFTLYANVFADLGYIYNNRPAPGNTFENSFLYSGGAGLDLVTYYDIVIRVDYSVNKKKEGGIFVTLITPFF
ncbi:MAG: BamA/TamA family outer membrane protein [Prevotellaceae bacterium]|jgi:outer membrane protein assembly factor BamA|nr:BamA/TamA family outer membrane protein [Prevotellaceae bacterium]